MNIGSGIVAEYFRKVAGKGGKPPARATAETSVATEPRETFRPSEKDPGIMDIRQLRNSISADATARPKAPTKAASSPVQPKPIFEGMPAPHELKLDAGQGTGWGQSRIAKNSEGKEIRVIDAYHAIRLPKDVDDKKFWEVFTPKDDAQSEATLDKKCWWGGSSLTEVVKPTPKDVWKRVQFVPEQEEHALKAGVHVPLAKLTMDLEKPKNFKVDGHEYTKIDAHFRPPSVDGDDKKGVITRPGDIHNLHEGKPAMEVTRVKHPNGESTVLVAWKGMVVQPRPDVYGLELDGLGTMFGKAVDPSVVHGGGPVGKLRNKISEKFLGVVLGGHDQALLPNDGDKTKGYPHLMHLLGVGDQYQGRVDLQNAAPGWKPNS
jgi:hypothetical protein